MAPSGPAPLAPPQPAGARPGPPAPRPGRGAPQTGEPLSERPRPFGAADLRSRHPPPGQGGALARLSGGAGLLLSPAQFLPALGAQDHHALFRQGLAQGLAALREWEKKGLTVDLSLNITPVTLLHPDCAAWITAALAEAGVAPARLTLELLEQKAVDDPAIDTAMRALAGQGIRFAIDDLGSGYSNLKRLLTLPIHAVKIDQSLLRELPYKPKSGIRLLSTLLQMAREIVPAVVMEGIETEADLEVLRRLGWPYGQGYALARPMPLPAFPAWAAARPRESGGAEKEEIRTWLGALAYQWGVVQQVGAGLPLPPLHALPLHRFLRRAGVEDPALRAALERLLGDEDGRAREEAAQALLDWIASHIEAIGAEAASRPPAPPAQEPRAAGGAAPPG